MPESLVAGWTEPIDQLLKADGTAINGTGLSVTLILRDRSGAEVDTSGKVDWLVASSGTVRYLPALDDLRVEGSPYTARWRVTSSGKYLYFPNAAADTWTVRR